MFRPVSDPDLTVFREEILQFFNDEGRGSAPSIRERGHAQLGRLQGVHEVGEEPAACCSHGVPQAERISYSVKINVQTIPV